LHCRVMGNAGHGLELTMDGVAFAEVPTSADAREKGSGSWYRAMVMSSEVSDNGAWGVLCENVTNVVLQDVKVEKNGAGGLTAMNSSAVLAAWCHVDANKSGGISLCALAKMRLVHGSVARNGRRDESVAPMSPTGSTVLSQLLSGEKEEATPMSGVREEAVLEMTDVGCEYNAGGGVAVHTSGRVELRGRCKVNHNDVFGLCDPDRVARMEQSVQVGPNGPALAVTSAMYGKNAWADVTAQVQEHLDAGVGLRFRVDNSVLGADPDPGQTKVLALTWAEFGQQRTGEWKEYAEVHIPAKQSLTIEKAWYGCKVTADVTAAVQRLAGMTSGGCVDVTNETLGGDPAPGQDKVLHVEYRLNRGDVKRVQAREYSSVTFS
jgi:hypothetical protein